MTYPHQEAFSAVAVEAVSLEDPVDDDDEVLVRLPVISDDQELLKRGICRIKLPKQLDIYRWANELSQVTPMNLGFEGDGEYAFYRNIMEEPEFPFDLILLGGGESEPESESKVSDIGRSMLRHFPILTKETRTQRQEEQIEDQYKVLSEELQLDDAFCVHYNMDQDDTTGKKHMDPSDITVNMCLQKSKDAKGSDVLFHGIKRLENLDNDAEKGDEDDNGDNGDEGEDNENESTAVPDPVRTEHSEEPIKDTNTDKSTSTSTSTPLVKEDNRFLVSQEPGYATIHFGDHPHETTSLRHGSRTNIILTYVYTDPNRSDVATRTCY